MDILLAAAATHKPAGLMIVGQLAPEFVRMCNPALVLEWPFNFLATVVRYSPER
ncbi:MAG: hypothetical protein ACHQLQ_13455 [Candidatus Acidiferrales bacterium]